MIITKAGHLEQRIVNFQKFTPTVQAGGGGGGRGLTSGGCYILLFGQRSTHLGLVVVVVVVVLMVNMVRCILF